MAMKPTPEQVDWLAAFFRLTPEEVFLLDTRDVAMALTNELMSRDPRQANPAADQGTARGGAFLRDTEPLAPVSLEEWRAT